MVYQSHGIQMVLSLLRRRGTEGRKEVPKRLGPKREGIQDVFISVSLDELSEIKTLEIAQPPDEEEDDEGNIKRERIAERIKMHREIARFEP